MVAEKTKKMPKGVGKRIIEKLKTAEPEAENIEYKMGETLEPVEELEEAELVEKAETTDKQELECEPTADYEETAETNYTCIPKTEDSTAVSNIDTLLNLISQLPSGVTKQTGALIIRQTMEAMGISMNNVLSNAQSAQEGLENSIKNNINVIEEFRTKIKILEQEIQKFRKKAHELEDIISLFILSEDKK